MLQKLNFFENLELINIIQCKNAFETVKKPFSMKDHFLLPCTFSKSKVEKYHLVEKYFLKP